MPKKHGAEIMMAFVQDYLDGTISRMDFDLDFSHMLMTYYGKMERENSDLAECFNFYIAEEGFDQTESFTDVQHKKLIRRQFNEFNAAMRDGFG
jgi:hypothetical protein